MKHPFLLSLVFALSTGFTCLAFAQTAESESAPPPVDSRPFIGFWEFPEPAGDRAVIIIKTGGHVSCFWTGSFSRAIERGTWVADANGLVLTWESGHHDRLERIGENALERRAFRPGTRIDGPPDYTARGVRVDSRLPGSLAVPRDSAAAPRDAIAAEAAPTPLRNPFIGFWRIPQSTGMMGIGNNEPNFFLRISRNGHASVALRNWNGDNAFRGLWEIDGNRIVITWPDNHRDVIEPDPQGGYALLSFRPRDALTGRPNDRRPAVSVPAMEAERYFAAGAFNRLTVSDIRGRWTPAQPTGQNEWIDIQGWGNAQRSRAANTSPESGKWRLQSDRVIIQWDGGATDVLRIDFPRILQESFAKDQPITGSPMRSIEVRKSN